MFRLINYARKSFSPLFHRAITTTSMNIGVKQSVSLNETEQKIRDILLEFCNHYNKSNQLEKSLELRITGGWVRDKLLGYESHDLDIAVNQLSGEEFVGNLMAYLQEYHPDFKMKNAHTIKRNPEKSKHLETCTTKLYGMDIDFVNLRSEKYSDDSRIPIIECGTAEEDALRRDATLNALFYNLNHDYIEDFTKLGLSDLKKGILRTPLAPLSTFIDDPLRVLRLIRFASKYDFTIEQETLMAMKTPDIKSNLLQKISRERIGVELEKILTSRDACYGLKLINHTNLTNCVFSIGIGGPVNDAMEKLNPAEVLQQYEKCNDKMVLAVNQATSMFPTFEEILRSLTKQQQKIIWLGLILSPFEDLEVKINAKKAGTVHVPEFIVKEGLRFGKHDFEPVSTMIKTRGETKSEDNNDILNRITTGNVTRSEVGIFMKQFNENGKLYIIFNMIKDIIESGGGISIDSSTPKPQVNTATTTENNTNSTKSSNTISTITKKYSIIDSYITTNNLYQVHNLKPIIDGKTISSQLNKKPGPWMAPVTQKVLIWQLDNPSGTPQQCLEYLQHIEI